MVNTHGVRGEVKVFPLTDNPNRFRKLNAVYLSDGGSEIHDDVEGVKFFKNLVILKLKDINSMAQAEQIKGWDVLVDRKDAIKLPRHSYFVADLIGCDVYEGDKFLGKIKEILKTGSNDVYVVSSNLSKKGEILIPAIKEVIKHVNIPKKTVMVCLPKGLIDL